MGEPISRRRLVVGAGGLAVFGFAGLSRAAPVPPVAEPDLVVYGGTAAGIVAAVQMRRMGGTAIVLEPSRHVGGMTTSGLGVTDTGETDAIGGIAAEFYRRIHGRYDDDGRRTAKAMYRFEPKVAQEVIEDLIAEHDLTVITNARIKSVVKAGTKLTHLVTDDGTAYRGRMFVDATYEGDLMAEAGVAYTTGREGNAKYDETLNGIQLGGKHQFVYDIDPLGLPGVSTAKPAPNGTADDKIQAYCYRMCLTRTGQRIPFEKPAGYDSKQYELAARYLAKGWRGPFFTTPHVGGEKTDSNNNGAFSTDHIGYSHGYPQASYARRQSIVDEHRTYQQGLMWFLAHDERVPPAIRVETNAWGLPQDEFKETNGWPPQLYVREARRMVASYVMTEHNCTGAEKAWDSIGLASYAMDSHHCQRVVVDGAVRNEGDVQVPVKEPYRIAYRAIIPKSTQATNLLVPVALSASHIAYGSLRMEPVFMILAQSAATAAKLAIDAGTTVQQVTLNKLQARLQDDGQRLDWTNA